MHCLRREYAEGMEDSSFIKTIEETKVSIETRISDIFSAALIWFAILILAMLIRSILGPRITDRLLSINMIGTMVICCIAILSRMLGESFLVDVALIYAMISFISVLILATIYIPNRHQRKPGKDGAEVRRKRGVSAAE